MKRITKSKFGIFRHGLATGLILQLAVGPIFFYITNLTLQKSFLDGLAAVTAVTAVDYFYIFLAIFGIGRLLEKESIKRVLGIVSPIVLLIFGLMIIYDVLQSSDISDSIVSSSNVITSFFSTFLLTISSPMTIVFFTGIFSAKAIEHDYKQKTLLIFGVAVGLTTFIFMGSSVVVLSIVKEAVPMILIKVLNAIVGGLLVTYGLSRLWSVKKIK